MFFHIFITFFLCVYQNKKPLHCFQVIPSIYIYEKNVVFDNSFIYRLVYAMKNLNKKAQNLIFIHVFFLLLFHISLVVR